MDALPNCNCENCRRWVNAAPVDPAAVLFAASLRESYEAQRRKYRADHPHADVKAMDDDAAATTISRPRHDLEPEFVDALARADRAAAEARIREEARAAEEAISVFR